METRLLIQSAPKPYTVFPQPSAATQKKKLIKTVKVLTIEDGGQQTILSYKLTLWAKKLSVIKCVKEIFIAKNIEILCILNSCLFAF